MSMSMSITSAPSAPVLSGSMNWEPVRKRLLGGDLKDALLAATELRENIEIVYTVEFPLMLSALLPAFSSVLAHRTRPSPDTQSVEHKFRNLVLDIISKMPSNEYLRPHAPHLIALAIDVLNRDYEENALLASRIIFDLYKVYRSLPPDYVQPYLDFVQGAYRALPAAIQRNFTFPAVTTTSPHSAGPAKTDTAPVESSEKTEAPPPLKASDTDVIMTDVAPASAEKKKEDEGDTKMPDATTTTPSAAMSVDSTGTSSLISGLPVTPAPRLALRSNISFRVLTECPLIVMLMFQLYPKFLKNNIPLLINVMMEAMALRAPPIQSLTPPNQQNLDSTLKRIYFSRARELVAAQAKTLSFLTYLLRSFSVELKPYEDRLASNVVALMSTCPRESIGTRKELLVATRHLLNSDFKSGFFRHVDALLDERVLMGSHHRFSDQTLLRPLGYTTLSDLVQHVRSMLTMSQMSRVVCMFSRVLHDSLTLPMSTQYTAVRTLLSLVEIIYLNKDPNAQIGRDMLVRTLKTLGDKLASLNEYFPVVMKSEAARETETIRISSIKVGDNVALPNTPPDTVRDLQSMIRAIIVGHKTVIYYINNYRNQNAKDKTREQMMPPPGSNEEVSSATLRLTNTEVDIVDKYIVAAFPAMKFLKEKGTLAGQLPGRPAGEKSLIEQHRDSLTYFAAAFTTLDGFNLRRTIGKRLELLVDAIVDDQMMMVVPRHLLGSNPTTSFEFCNLLLNYLMERMDLLARPKDVVFVDLPSGHDVCGRELVMKEVQRSSQFPVESEERQKQRSTTLLQLFERVLKSLSSFAENEAGVVRRRLRKIVVVCLRSSLENTVSWPDNYCMLLRYLFRSISAGKFEESYKELLPLIPTVLNGLYRVICASEDLVLRQTAIELCLTIPARLSSLLPHMNLLLRVIIPALDSRSGDLVNLGLRTLEFWVDNLNPLFLYPEMTKQTELFASLMQALSRHLRPAPYPYGLLTLRLLGKLGGKNRQFLRGPLLLCDPADTWDPVRNLRIAYTWSGPSLISGQENTQSVAGSLESVAGLTIPLPLDRALEMLKRVAFSHASHDKKATQSVEPGLPQKDETISWAERSRLLSSQIENIDFSYYCNDVMESTKDRQVRASLTVVRAAMAVVLGDASCAAEKKGDAILAGEDSSRIDVTIRSLELKPIALALMYASMIDSLKDKAWPLLKSFATRVDPTILSEALVRFMSEPSVRSASVGTEFLKYLLQLPEREGERVIFQRQKFSDSLLQSLCELNSSCSWDRQAGLQDTVCLLIDELGSEWALKFEARLVNAALLSVKSVPREVSNAALGGLRFFIRVCIGLYGAPWLPDGPADCLIWDILAVDGGRKDSSSLEHEEAPRSSVRPSEEVIRVALFEMASAQQIVRFAARFLLMKYVIPPSNDEAKEFVSDHLSLIRRVLFSRSLKLLPLPQQVGVVEGLAVIIKEIPGVIPLSDQHLLAFLSELLKMSSVADGEMADSTLKDFVVDKNGYTVSSFHQPVQGETNSYPSHASALFFRRECVLDVHGRKVVVPEELPAGVQLRVSSILLLHSVIRGYPDPFFDAKTATPVGNIRPHVISLLFRSLVSTPLKSVVAAHNCLRDVISLSAVAKGKNEPEGTKAQSRLPKELLQTCIRPVLLNLRDYKRLSVPLLRGLSRLLSLLSSWFNKTLGEKLLDHLQKWTDPALIIPQKIWKEGDEPLVAAAIVDIFALLPHASHFVEPLVKTCIKLEAALPAFKARYVESPYQKPLFRYLNKHPQHAVNFFFQRLKTPMYSELLQNLVKFDESDAFRAHLGEKQCSVMILNVCFERPLAIIRSEKNSSSSPATRNSISIHGIGSQVAAATEGSTRPMTVESLELQLQGFRLVQTLLSHNADYFQDHNDIVRAFRWLWRSKGRFLRLQHEDVVSPRFHEESKMLASFLMSYAKTSTNEDLDILFELIRVFLQPSTTDFTFVSQFLADMVSHVLTFDQKEQVMKRFFSLLAGESSEETKVLSIQLLIFPMIAASYRKLQDTSTSSIYPPTDTGKALAAEAQEGTSDRTRLVDATILEKFVKEVLFHHGSPISCGDRLKVELLRLSDLFLVYATGDVEPVRKDMVRFCWGLLKSEDTPCKSWSYIVVCRFISAFETSSKIILQVCAALLRSHQQEGKELVRNALDLLIPILPKRLSEEEFRKVVDQASQMMLEDGNSVPQLAHICQTIVRSPDVFYPHRHRFVRYIVNSLNRLGLPPNCPQESRTLAVDLVELLLTWESQQGTSPPAIFTNENGDTVSNFLVRLKILMAEPADARSPKVDAGVAGLDQRVTELFRRIVALWDGTIRLQPFEKVVSRERPDPGLLFSCLDILTVLLKAKRYDLFKEKPSLVKGILVSSFTCSRDDVPLREMLKGFILETQDLPSIVSLVAISLEKIIVDATHDQRNTVTARSPGAIRQGGSRTSREKPASSSEDSSSVLSFASFSLELIAEMCRRRREALNRFSNSILELASTLAKNHLLDAAAKQRKGSSQSPTTSSGGMMYHTTTVGILEEACMRDTADTARSATGKSRVSKDVPTLTTTLRSLILILSIFECSDTPYIFTQSRKILFQILGNILDTSDSVQLLMVAVRIVGKWLVADGLGTPVTTKERNSFLWKMSSLDYTALPDDVAAQPLADLVGHFILRLSASTQKSRAGDDQVLDRSLVACLLNANEEIRSPLLRAYLRRNVDDPASSGLPVLQLLWRLLHSDLEGLSARFWIVLFVDTLLMSIVSKDIDCVSALRVLAHGDVAVCQRLFESLLPAAWRQVQDDQTRLHLVAAIESLLSRSFHSQFLRESRTGLQDRRPTNAVRCFLSALSLLRPLPFFENHLLVHLAENYNSWYEVHTLLERQYDALTGEAFRQTTLSAMRHCYRQLGENGLWMSLARESCTSPESKRAISLDIYGMVNEAVDAYSDLVGLVEAPDTELTASEFEMETWEERWIELQRELCQLQVVAEFAKASESPRLQLEVAWKSHDWNKVRSLCSSTALLASVESGDPVVKMSETLLAVADGKLSDVENLHAQTAQLCLYKWQLLPQLSCGSLSHSSLLHFFHRLVEIRESGQIMVETSNHSNGRTLPDLKNLLNAWRHRLPNDCEPLTVWDEVFSWRAQMFTAITANFNWSEPNTLATLHDRPWTTIRMAKTARKQGMPDVALLLLNKAVEERAMNVSDAFLKLREQILAYYNPDSELERHGGLNLINTTNLSFFDPAQNSELFRLKAMFLTSLGGKSKANQAYCHSVQICPTHARAWDSWGGLCASLGAVAEKQVEQQAATSSTTDETGKDQKLAAAKKIAQYLAQAMGCYLEAIQIEANEWSRIHLPKCLWMLTRDASSHGVLCQTFESRGSQLPSWVWLPWIPQLLTSLYRHEGRAVKAVLSRLVKSYPQAVYFPLRAFYLERRDVERAKSSSESASSSSNLSSVAYAEEMMSLLRRSHASLWSSLESILEELIVKFRPSYEEELLSTIIALLERAETQVGSIGKSDDEDTVVASVWKTLGRIAAKFFRTSETTPNRHDERAKKTAEFKRKYKESFEADFHVSSIDAQPSSPDPESKSPLSLEEYLERLRTWKLTLETHVLSTPDCLALIESSSSLAVFGVGDAPDLWPGSCDPRYASSRPNDREPAFEGEIGTTQSSTSSSAAAARKAATTAANAAVAVATREGVGGDYGGGSSCIEIPGQYMPNNSSWADIKPGPELHPKLLRFEPSVKVLRRDDQLVRRIGMLGSDGRTYRFLLQFAVPYSTRTDERTTQTYYVLDKVLRKGTLSSRNHISVQPNAVIPVAQRLRLVSEPDSRTSLDDVHRHGCFEKGKAHESTERLFNNEVQKALRAKGTEGLEEDGISKPEKMAKLEIYNKIRTSVDVNDSMVLQYLHSALEGPEPLFQFRRMFAQQWATNCLFQYVFSVAERTPSRVVFIKCNGGVLSPDFRISYGSHGFIESQLLPFRMTPNISTLIGFPLMDGRFISSMVTVAGAVRNHKEDMDPIFLLLMRDDSVAFFTKSMAKSDAKTHEMEKQLADRVTKNVASLQARFGECAPKKQDESTKRDPVDKRVRDLVDEASSPEKLCMMPGNYQAWL